ncbi:alcohol dehydrogenase catalytic domain-containing protein [Candidatus Leptofilum sp.]|uniref:alcohol dehydrogenase catalytic domain-containing protein n=1 Tax=Candidatus Leptofilum sp. TaxID=3241576 RepID=UPI003B5A88C3
MMKKYELYRSAQMFLPAQTWAWNMYGAGIENIGRDGHPEAFPIPEPADNQLLVRVDSVGMCFSDVKLIRQGGSHPKLYNRNLAEEPTRLGHEAALTIIKVGKDLAETYHPGQRLAIQPDIYQDGRSTAYGYTIPGGLTQYHLIGPEVLDADDGAYVLPLEDELGYAETALTEPWACVEASYTQRRRLQPKAGGSLWVIGQLEDEAAYTFSGELAKPSLVVFSDVPESVKHLIQQKVGTGVKTAVRDGLRPSDYPTLKAELTNDEGFDDIIMLSPRSAKVVSEAAKLTAFRGTFNLVGESPLDDKAEIDVGRIHYHYTAYVGNLGPDIAASYGEARNRCDLRPGGAAVFVGAGGPMGQMHVQRAIEQKNGPNLIIATEVNEMRLAALEALFAPLAEANGKQLLTFNPATEAQSLHDFVRNATDQIGADDVVICVPVASLMAEAGTYLAPDGMLVLFAGVPNGTMAELDMGAVYLHNAQFTGTSGSALADQATVIAKTVSGDLSPNRSVAAVGGMEAARDGVEAMMEGRYPGKVVIFPQISGLPLLSLAELKETYPDIAEQLGDGDVWTPEAEAALVEAFWQVDHV